jgi:hypothetical protein
VELLIHIKIPETSAILTFLPVINVPILEKHAVNIFKCDMCTHTKVHTPQSFLDTLKMLKFLT